jgi:predicted unusual protein kinase regulating ubiquinone biosynthesis (AarF/ABC1/UbiB family)
MVRMPERHAPNLPIPSRAQRGAQVARLSASTGASFLASRLRGLVDDNADERFHTETAQRIVELLGSMKGAAMKLGQIASFVDFDADPQIQAVYHEVLGDLQDAAPPVDSDVTSAVIEQEYGAPPDQAFARWDPEPIASASIGQVHRARLHDGTEVVTKIQYPGVAEAVHSDLANAEAFAPLGKMLSPHLRIRPLVEELRARLTDELDYQREAAYQQAFFERYDGHPFIRVPRIHLDWCRPRVLVSDYVCGRDFEGMLASTTPAQRERYGEIIYRFIFGSLNRFRLFNADPHPGNYLFPQDGSVVFLDFGSVKMFRRETRALLMKQLDAVIAGDAAGLVDALQQAGFFPASIPDPAKLLKWWRAFNEPVLEDREWTYTPEYAREVGRMTSDPRGGYADLMRKLNLPPEYLLLNRIHWGVNSILGRLGARANWHRIMLELRGGPPATDLGRVERPFIDASPFLA